MSLCWSYAGIVSKRRRIFDYIKSRMDDSMLIAVILYAFRPFVRIK